MKHVIARETLVGFQRPFIEYYRLREGDDAKSFEGKFFVDIGYTWRADSLTGGDLILR